MGDRGLDELLYLDGVVLVVDPNGGHWVKFVAKKVDPSPERPHGVSYSLTLHAADGERIVGFDNAHAVFSGSGPARRTHEAHDHRHRRSAASPVPRCGDAAARFLKRGRRGVENERDHPMKVLRIGVAPYEDMKARTMAIARGEFTPGPDEPKLWFTSIESLARVLSDKNRALIDLIIERRPQSLADLEQLSGRARSNLSRTLKSMARFGLVELVEGEGRTLRPRVPYDEIQLDLPMGRRWRMALSA
jgi:predicted transcriptional regulator